MNRVKSQFPIAISFKWPLVRRLSAPAGWLLIFLLLGQEWAIAQGNKPPKPVPPIAVGADGRLAYATDEQGNRVPDFSYAGYMAGAQPIPNAPIRVVVPEGKGDATQRIQAALDYVASLPPDANGLRGAVLLDKGRYEVGGSLHIRASGVVLRGSGTGEKGTLLLATNQNRATLIRIAGKNDQATGKRTAVLDPYVPVNAIKLKIAPGSVRAGDAVLVHRPSTQKWIDALGADHFGGGITYLGWKPGQRDLYWDRTVVDVDGETVTLDAPLTTALDTTYGGGSVIPYTWPGRITQVGVENLRCQSVYDTNNAKDEDHAWMAITIDEAADAWVRQVVFRHFAGSAVLVGETAKRVTVEDCRSLAPISEIGGQRRYTFLTNGQQTLFQRCYAEYGYHDFAVGFCAPGPNAFVQCESHLPYSFSGTIDSWASGVLFDIVNVDGQALSYLNRGQDGQGAGWSAANSVFWQSTAARIDCYKPPTAQNWAFGCWAQFAGNGHWDQSNEHIRPRSLYYAQLAARLGKGVEARANLLPVESEASSSPSVEVAAALTKQALKPAPLLRDWIEQASVRQPIPIQATGAKPIEAIGYKVRAVEASKTAPMQVRNGWLVRGTSILTGGRQEVPWWSGSSRVFALAKAKPHITRFVPGRIGNGLTDNLDELTDSLLSRHVLALEHNYALWYDRRRDDHERIRRMDGEVWPPFYEVPFARSGKEIAWDGLSKYDLTRYNKWYWGRLKEFADLADRKGLVLVHQQYFQHNIIEAGAHYADFAWRPANNINNTGFPEPVPYAGDKRIFMAEQFYDVSHPVRRKLHQAYIRKSLENFSTNTGVIQLIGAEFTGPLHFVQFWLDTIREWEKETGKNAVIGLSTTKDVQDAILADKGRAPIIDLIDIRYWHYRADGTTYAPEGGQNLAPRQHARLVKPGSSSFDQVYRAVSEYRQKYPGKAVVYSGPGYDALGWASFMAGGSMASLPQLLPQSFLAQAAQMQPIQTRGNVAGQWMLGNASVGFIVYSNSALPIVLDSKGLNGPLSVSWIDPKSGREIKSEKVEGGKMVELKKPVDAPIVLWLSRPSV